MSERTRRRRAGRLDREKWQDRLHLLADGPLDELHNEFSVHGFRPLIARQLWDEHGENITAEWKRTGHQPSAWWLGLAKRAGIAVPAGLSVTP